MFRELILTRVAIFGACRRRPLCTAAAVFVALGCLATPIAAQGANLPPVSCSPSTVFAGTSASCTATGSAGETFTFRTTAGLGTLSASTCTVPATANSCSVVYTGVTPSQDSDPISYTSNLFAGAGATTETVSAQGNSVACAQSAVVVDNPDPCTATFPTSNGDTASFFPSTATDGTFDSSTCVTNPISCSVHYTPAATETPQTINAFFDDSATVATVLSVVHSVASGVTCTPSSLVATISATSCTVTVTDTTPAAQKPTLPTGTVSVTTAGPGSLSNSRCSLTGNGVTSSCALSYAPSGIGSGIHVINATYDGDATHAVDSSSTSVAVAGHATSTTMVCSPGVLAVGQSATCSATVSDTAGAVTPGGMLSFSSNGPSGFSPAACMLSGTGATASCAVSYTPHKGGAGKQAVTAAFGGDAVHAASSGSANVTVTHPEGLSTATSVSCSPAIVVPGNSASCVATVRDTGGGGAMTPTGSVTFSTVGGGTVNPSGACTLTGSGGSASCRATYRPGAGAADTQTITAVYGGDLVHEGDSGFTNVALPPQTGVTAVVSVVRGQVLISLPGGGRAVAAAVGPPPAASFVPLKGVTRSVPIGSTLDTRKGVVRLVTAADDRGPLNPHHQTQSGTFAAAEFTIKQMTTAERLAAAKRQHRRRLTGIPATNLLLTNPFSAFTHAHCGRTRHPGHGVIRELSAVAKGLYRTVGAASTTVVHNATWIVKDRCDGTFSEVGRGSAVVQYKVNGRQRSQVVKPGQSFFVRRPFLPPIRKGR